MAFSIVPARAAVDPGLGHAAFRLLAMICVFASRRQGGACYPSTRTLAEALGLGERSVQIHMKELEERKYITREARKRKDGRSSTNLIIVRYDDIEVDAGEAQIRPRRAAKRSSASPPESEAQLHPHNSPDSNSPRRNGRDSHVGEESPDRRSEHGMEGGAGGGADAPAAPGKPTRNRRTRLSPDWRPTEADVEYLRKVGITDRAAMNRQALQFRDHHLAKGTVMADWAAAWRTWCRNARDWGTGGNPRSNGHANGSGGDPLPLFG